MDAVAVAVDPAQMTFGFEDENPPFVDGEAVDLQKFSVGDDVVLDVTRVGAGIGFGKITINENIFGVEDFFEAKDQAGFGGGEFDRIGRSDFGAWDFVCWFHSIIKA